MCLAICGAAIKSVQIVQFRAKLAEAQSFDQTAEHDQARRLIEELLAEDADHPEVLRLYARNAAAMREWRQAADALVKLPEKQPDDLFLEATLFTNLQRYDDAARSWSRLSIVSDQADAMLKSYLQQLHESGNVAQVVDLVRKLTQTPDGRLPTAHTTLAVVLRRNGRTTDAARHFEKAFRLSTDVTDRQRIDLAEALLRLPERRDVQEILDGVDGPLADWLRSRAALQTGNVQQADRYLSKLDQQDLSSIQQLLVERGEPAPLVGSTSCAECHAKNFQSQSDSPHAHTFGSLEAERFKDLTDWKKDPLNARAEHHISLVGSAIQATARNADGRERRVELICRLGSGTRGVTCIGRDEQGVYWEHRLSWYPSIGWDVTTGQTAETKESPPIGERLPWLHALECIRCHNTDMQSAGAVLDSGRPTGETGVHCESCHGPGGNHLQAVKLNFSDLAILQPGKLTDKQSVQLCASCHEPDHPVDPTDPSDVRFQAATFVASKCFLHTDSFSCVSCHDPHTSVSREERRYDQVCSSCHSRPHAASEMRIDSSQSCVACHMPRVPGGMRNTTFADHYIRVHPLDKPSAP